MSKLIFGCGYLGRRVAARWLQAGCAVHAVTRSTERAASLAAAGLQPLVGDVLAPASLRNLPVAETVLAALPPGTGRIIYVSSTGVYGQSDDAWVDETSACQPEREGGAACLAAEDALLQSPWARQSLILRMSGIYGPGRIPRRRELEAGRPLAAPQHGYLNLIHVEDAARAVLAAESEAALPQVYCVTDGHPVVRGEYYRFLAHLLRAPVPSFREPPPDSPAQLRAASSKRVRPARFCTRFEFHFEYPSYREGLAAIVAAEASERA
jgi:nucleoside-diphosphate-sugar epimerase